MGAAAAQARACERLADDLREGSLSEIHGCNYTCYRTYLDIIVHSQGAVNREPPAAGAAQEPAAVAWGGWRGLRLAAPALYQHPYKHSLHSLYLYFCMNLIKSACCARYPPAGRSAGLKKVPKRRSRRDSNPRLRRHVPAGRAARLPAGGTIYCVCVLGVWYYM